MHDHDPRRPHCMVRTSPPQICDFIPNVQSHLKQVQQQHCQQQMQHQQYQQHYLHQHHSSNHNPPQHVKKCSQDSHFIFANPNFPPTTSSSAVSEDIYNVDEFEDVDEDQISDLDDEEEELRLSYERYRQNFHKGNDVTSQLLEFADVVSADIKKFFGRAKDQDDSCDVYEDKWVTAKSGRELYYADLLRVAQGDTEPASKTKKHSLSSLSSPSSSSLSPHQEYSKRSQFSGKRDDSVGMGPLTALFEYGFPSFIHGAKDHQGVTSVARSKVSSHTMSRSQKLVARVIPMHERNFPESFWREPCTRVNGLTSNCSNRLEISQHNMLSSSKLPDFSDLVESWQGGIEGMAASDIDKRGSTNVDHQRL